MQNPCSSCGTPVWTVRNRVANSPLTCRTCRKAIADTRTCKECGAPYHAKGYCKDHYMKYCHKQDHSKVVRSTYPVTCKGCGCTFQCSTKTKKQYCTYRCAMRYHVPSNKKKPGAVALYVRPPRASRKQWTPTHQVTWKSIRCATCGTWFISKWVNEASCSDECLRVHRTHQRAIAKDRRRARKKAAYVADVYRKKVWQLDGYRCHLCGKKTDPTKQAPHPKAPTIDHVIPLAAGGTHEPANCRTAHFICNSRKGARGGYEQLALDIGA